MSRKFYNPTKIGAAYSIGTNNGCSFAVNAEKKGITLGEVARIISDYVIKSEEPKRELRKSYAIDNKKVVITLDGYTEVTVQTYNQKGKLLLTEVFSIINLPGRHNSHENFRYLYRQIRTGDAKHSVFKHLSAHYHGYLTSKKFVVRHECCNGKWSPVYETRFCFCDVTEKVYFSPFKTTEDEDFFSDDGIRIGVKCRKGREEFRYMITSESLATMLN